MAPHIFGIVGWSKTGKTAMVEQLIAEFVRRGYKVATLKHDVHGFEADIPGRDSWRHRAAGALATCLVGPDQIALFRGGATPSIDQVISMLGDVDLVLAEGFKDANWPKMEMHQGSGPLSRAGDPWLIAAAGPRRPRTCSVPWYHWDEVPQICNMIENTLLAGLARRWSI